MVFLVVAFAFLALGWMLFLPTILTRQLRTRSGFDATVDRLAFNPITGRIEMRGFVVSNPPTFPLRDFIELREFRANADVGSLFSDQPIFDTMVVNVATVTLVKREDGMTNAAAFEENIGDYGGRRLVSRSPQDRHFLIRHLDLRIDRLVVADHSLRNPHEREFILNLNQSYTDVTRLDQLLAPAVLRDLAPVAAALGGLVPGELGRALTEAGRSGTEVFREAGRRAGERVKGFFDALEESKKP